jgi:signal peptide peptidase SppA
MTDLAHIAALAFNTPLLIEPRKAEIIGDVLLARLSGEAMSLAIPEAAMPARRKAAPNRFDAEPRDRYRFADGVALIGVSGTLVNRGAWVGAYSGLSSYEGLAASLRAARDDADVAMILLDLDSPGGQAIGAFEAAELVRAVAQVKQVVAHVNGMAASAAYAIASAATRIVATPSAIVGSIGVVMMHLDRSQQLAKAGVKPTLIHAGARKVDGNPFEPLPDDVRARFQAEIDDLYAMFVATVAKGRPMSEDAIRETEAQTFSGQKALDIGLADSLADIEAELAAFKPRGGMSRLSKGATMSQENGSSAPEAGVTREQIDALMTSAYADGLKTGVAGERTRIAAILGHAEATGREATARKLAFTTAMSVEDAAAFLADLPKAEPKATLGERVPRVNLGAGEGGEGEQPTGVAGEMAAGARAAQALLAQIGLKK